MNAAFTVHILNDQGKAKAQKIAEAFDELVGKLQAIGCSLGQALTVDGKTATTRAGAIVMTKLEEACFFAKKDMAQGPDNHE